jgi:cobyrinic acid a,c-diamide synthase
MRGFVVAAAHSGSGKTTLTLSLVLALRARGLRVQTFKVGPDYLDASLLTWASGRPCRNLDAWMVPEEQLLELFQRATSGADVAVVEGVMGLFDGRSGETDQASTAHIARLLGLPILLLVDAQAAARTVGAVALGLASADPRLETVGVVLNRIAGDRHLEVCRSGVEAVGLPLLGHLTRMPALALPERYLGLVGAEERAPGPAFRRALKAAGAGLDLDGILARARRPVQARTAALFPERRRPARTVIAIARDAAFNFYYQDSLDLLEAWGAELVPFSPLADTALPERVGGVYLGGGYPELHAASLAANRSMLGSLRSAMRQGTTVYAECGGAMYVGAGIEDAEGRRHRMAGLWPGWSTLRRRRLKLGYRSVRASPGNPLHPLEVSAHEFHYSRPLGREMAPSTAAWEVLDEPGRTEGWASRRLLASYIHLHLGSRPGLAERVVAACS